MSKRHINLTKYCNWVGLCIQLNWKARHACLSMCKYTVSHTWIDLGRYRIVHVYNPRKIIVTLKATHIYLSQSEWNPRKIIVTLKTTHIYLNQSRMRLEQETVNMCSNWKKKTSELWAEDSSMTIYAWTEGITAELKTIWVWVSLTEAVIGIRYI